MTSIQALRAERDAKIQELNDELKREGLSEPAMLLLLWLMNLNKVEDEVLGD